MKCVYPSIEETLALVQMAVSIVIIVSFVIIRFEELELQYNFVGKQNQSYLYRCFLMEDVMFFGPAKH